MSNDQILIPAANEALATRADMSLGHMLQDFLKNPEALKNVEVAERMFALYERAEQRNSEREFASAFSSLQSEMPRITHDKTVPDKNGNVKFRFASYESIMEAVRPLLQKHGFAVTFSMDFKEGRIIQNCTLQHIGGHSRTNSFAARIGNGPPGASETQADGAASTYAKRFAFCNALNITIDGPDLDEKPDARNDGDVISDDKVQYLREEVHATNSDETKFLNLAGVKRFEDIRQGSYDVLVRALAAKARK